MKIDKNFNFEIGLSVNFYKTKEEVKLCLSSIGAKSANMDKLSFFNHITIDLDTFLYAATSGYAFCNLFKYDLNKKYRRENINPKYKVKYIWEYPEYKRGANKGAMKLQFKCDEFFEGSQCIFVDIDYTKYQTLDEYISNLKQKPTIAYCTYSDKLKGTRKFRLCYVFDTILDEFNFLKVSRLISKMVEESTGESLVDDCGIRQSQYFNGTMNNEETYHSYLVYNSSDFYDSNIYAEIIPTNIIPEELKVPDLEFIKEMEELTYDEFMHKNSKKYKYFWRVDNGNWINDKIQIIDESYFSLYYNTVKLRNGDCRRRKLFQRMALRRIINNDATPNDILFNAYVDLAKFIDNTEDPITIDDLVRNVKSCFKYTVEDLEVKFAPVIKLAKEKTTPKNGKIYKDKNSIKEGNYSLIDIYYDQKLSPKENMKKLEENDIKVGLSSIYEYCKDRKLNTKKLTQEEIFSLLDLNLSLRENKQLLENNYNINISKDTINKIIKKYNKI